MDIRKIMLLCAGLSCAALLVLCAAPGFAAEAGGPELADTSPPLPGNPDDEATELWTGALYTSTYRVGICISSAGYARGVLHLRLANGKVDVYHFSGTARDGGIVVRHSSGHVFEGSLIAPDRVEGVIFLKNGMRFRLDGKRERNVPLVLEDCAPVPE